MSMDRFAEFGLTEADTPFYKAVRDGFKASGLTRAQLNEALGWYRDVVHGRPGLDESALYSSFFDFATNRGWDTAQIVAAQGIRDTIQTHGVEAVMVPAPTAAEDAATIERPSASEHQ
jgi:hypothetical protein